MEKISNKNDNVFNIEYTLFIKGIAILILLLHHLVMSELSYYNLTAKLIYLTKVSVLIFTILSGYGLTKSYEKNTQSDIKFVFNHFKKLIIKYWWVYIPAFILSFFLHIKGNPFQIYGLGIKGILNFITEFVGLRGFFYTPTLNGTWWYMEVVIIFYLLFPFIYKAMKKFPILMIIISAIPILHFDSIGKVPMYLICADRELYYLLPFLLGIFFADKKIFDQLVNYCNNIRNRKLIICFSVICMLLLILLCFQQISMYFRMTRNIIYAFLIIIFGIGIKPINKHINNALILFGRHSMNIFLVHSFYHEYFTIFYKLIKHIYFFVFKYIMVLTLSLTTSIAIEKIKNKSSKIKFIWSKKENEE